MKDMIAFAYEHLTNFLRLAGALQIGLAILSFFLPKILDWKADIARMPLLLRQVFEIHAWYISLVLLFWGVLTLRFAPEMAQAPTDLSRWLCGAIALFWGLRSLLQWFHYSSTHWRGIPSRTVMHWCCFLGYAAWAIVYAMAAVA